jgi:hypothetical protein
LSANSQQGVLHAPLVSFSQKSFLALLWFGECGRERDLAKGQDFTKPIIPCSPTQVCFMAMQEGINLLFFSLFAFTSKISSWVMFAPVITWFCYCVLQFSQHLQ